MAYKDSGEIANNSNYALGDYSFRIERTSVPGSTNDKIEAVCTDKDGKNARKSIQVPSSTQLIGWYVEANETEATVYAVEKIPVGGEKTSPLIPYPVPISGYSYEFDHYSNPNWGHTTVTTSANCPIAIYKTAENYARRVEASASETSATITSHYHTVWDDGRIVDSDSTSSVNLEATYTYNGKTVHYRSSAGRYTQDNPQGYIANGAVISYLNAGELAWTMIYGSDTGDEYKTKQVIVGRFAIDLEDAGGVGPGSDWIDPGDYDPDWEEGDPTHTLYVTVTGALSGRHNDPIEDPSYSYIPADKDTVKDYGCGGDGGHGGGGGAGASTVVIHKFATNQANSKEVTAIARRHGYGSGGGKGGKGGDGCILVYY